MTALSANDAYWLERRFEIAAEEVRRITPEMLIHEMREALKDVPGLETLTIEYEPSGHQKLTIGDKVLEVGPMASNDEIRLALQNPFIPTANTKLEVMSITGATHLAASIQAKIQAAKDRMAAATSNTDAALTKLNAAADSADAVSTSIAKEADDLMAQIGQFTNGGPA